MKEKNYAIEHLHWDSNLFGYKTGKLTGKHLTADDFQKVISRLRMEKFRLCYWPVLPEDNLSLNTADHFGLTHADHKVTFVKKLTGISGKIDEKIKSYDEEKISPELLNLAYESGQYSRFKADTNFKNSEFEKLYSLWMENSVKRDIASEVLVYNEGSNISGFVTLQTIHNDAHIGLIAVDAAHRGMKIGEKLVLAAEVFSKEQGYNELYVATQKSNTGAYRFYEKNGFILCHSVHIYHIWM